MSARFRAVCQVDGCTRWAQTRHLCRKHYTRWLRHGTTDDPVPNVVALQEFNRERHTATIGRQVARAEQALAVLDRDKAVAARMTPGMERALVARCQYPHDTVAELGARLGVSKNTAWGWLRRAILLAERSA
jgi:hypothetical protein